MIPLSTHYKVVNLKSMIVFEGNAKNARRFAKKCGKGFRIVMTFSKDAKIGTAIDY